MKILKLFVFAIALTGLAGCVSVTKEPDKTREKEKVIVVPEKKSTDY